MKYVIFAVPVVPSGLNGDSTDYSPGSMVILLLLLLVMMWFLFREIKKDFFSGK